MQITKGFVIGKKCSSRHYESNPSYNVFIARVCCIKIGDDLLSLREAIRRFINLGCRCATWSSSLLTYAPVSPPLPPSDVTLTNYDTPSPRSPDLTTFCIMKLSTLSWVNRLRPCFIALDSLGEKIRFSVVYLKTIKEQNICLGWDEMLGQSTRTCKSVGKRNRVIEYSEKSENLCSQRKLKNRRVDIEKSLF